MGRIASAPYDGISFVRGGFNTPLTKEIYPFAVAGVCSCNHENYNLDSQFEISNLNSQFGISLGIHMVAGANSCNGSKKNGMVKLLKPIPFHLIVILFDLRG